VTWDTLVGFLLDQATSNKQRRAQQAAAAAAAAAALPTSFEELQQDSPTAASGSEGLQLAEGAVLAEDATRSVNTIATAMDFVTKMIPMTATRLACATRTGCVHLVSLPEYTLVSSVKLGGYSAMAATYVHDRTLNQSVPGIYAVRSFLAIATTGMKLVTIPAKEFNIRCTLHTPDLLTCLSFAHDDQVLYGGTQSGHALAFRVDPKGELRYLYRVAFATDVIHDLVCISGYRVIIGTADHACQVAEIDLSRESFKHDTVNAQSVSKKAVCAFGGITCSASMVAYASRLKIIIAALMDFSICCFAEGCPTVPAYRLDDISMPHSTPIMALSVDRSGTMLFSADKSGLGKLWNLVTLTCSSTQPVIINSVNASTAAAAAITSKAGGAANLHMALCAATLLHSNTLLINTNTSLHVLNVERPVDAVAGMILEDGTEPVVLVQHSTRHPNILYVISATSIVHWNIKENRRELALDGPYIAISAACIDPTCARVVLGGNGGELSVVRLDTGRKIRSYAMLSSCGEIVSVQWAVTDGNGSTGSITTAKTQRRSMSPQQHTHDNATSAAVKRIVALSESGLFIVVEDAGENEFGDCPVVRVLPLDLTFGAGCRRLIAHRATELYTVWNASFQVHSFVYDDAEGIIRAREVTSQPRDVSAQIALGDFAADAIASMDGMLAIWFTKPHVLADTCVCRWPNRPTGVGEFASVDHPVGLPYPTPISRVHHHNSAGRSRSSFRSTGGGDGSDSPASSRSCSPPGSPLGQALQLTGSSFIHNGPIVNAMLFVPPYTLITADDARQLTIWDISDCVLNARMFEVPSLIKKAQAVASGAAGCTYFHTMPRNPVVRCVAAIQVPQPVQTLGWLRPNVVVVIDFTSKPHYYAICGAGLVEAVVDGGASELLAARTAAVVSGASFSAAISQVPVSIGPKSVDDRARWWAAPPAVLTRAASEHRDHIPSDACRRRLLALRAITIVASGEPLALAQRVSFVQDHLAADSVPVAAGSLVSELVLRLNSFAPDVRTRRRRWRVPVHRPGCPPCGPQRASELAQLSLPVAGLVCDRGVCSRGRRRGRQAPTATSQGRRRRCKTNSRHREGPSLP
jgi:hypothetical protein